MAVVDTWDGANRRIYLASGVTEFHPIDDVYREYRTARRIDESFRVWEPFMRAVGHEPKGGGKYTPRYLLLLDGVKIICFDESTTITVTGEVLTDDQTDPFDYSTRTQPVVVRYQPAEAELISVGTSGLTAAESQALLDIDTNVDGLVTDVATMNSILLLLQAAQDLTNEQMAAEHITQISSDPANLPGKIILRNPSVSKRWEADAWEDSAGTIGYRKTGLEKAGVLVEVAWS